MAEWESLSRGSRIFFVGIGGISMSGLAEIASSLGYTVAGSDKNPAHRTVHLTAAGLTVYQGHRPDWIDRFKPDLVVHTAAVHADNPERIRAGELGIPVIDRATFLGWINRMFSRVINISGTHGKTTTTALCSLLLIESGLDPTVHLGAELRQFQGTIRIGQPGQTMVSEACEYMNSFHKFYSTTAAVLNIDYDHVDCFESLDAVIESFTQFTDLLPDQGYLVIPDFDPQVRIMADRLARRRQASGRPLPRLVVFGFADSPQPAMPWPAHVSFLCQNLVFEQGMARFEVWLNGTYCTAASLKIPGRHNVANALAAVACAYVNGGSIDTSAHILSQFQGAEGRFTDIGTYRGARVIADYAHHPAAARVTLAAAALVPHKKLWVVFQPLTFSRTRVLFDDYVDALKDCDWVIFSEIYSDRETDPGNISSRMVADRINELGGRAEFAGEHAMIRDRLDQLAGPGDLILVLGPENIRDFADELTGRTSHLD